jgi:hypothetical protein
MGNPEHPKPEDGPISHAVVSFVVRLHPGDDGALKGVARHIQTGEEAPFADLQALAHLMQSRCTAGGEE